MVMHATKTLTEHEASVCSLRSFEKRIISYDKKIRRVKDKIIVLDKLLRLLREERRDLSVKAFWERRYVCREIKPTQGKEKA